MESGRNSAPAPLFKQLRRAYGFDEVAIVPGEFTINPELVELGLSIGHLDFKIPFLASAMDAVVDPHFAIEMHAAGGLAVLNLEGVWTRYDNPSAMLQEVFELMQQEGYSTLPVVQKGRLVGIVSLENIGAWLMIQSGRQAGGFSQDADHKQPV